MTDYIKDSYAAIFSGPMGWVKSHLILDLIEKEYNKNFDYIIITCPMFRLNNTYCNKGSVRHDENV